MSKDCAHGVPLLVPNPPRCPDCEIIWHERGLADAKRAVEHHKRKLDEAIAEKSRQCGDA